MSVPYATLGPCSAWIDGQDVMRVCSADPGSPGPSAFDQVAYEASQALYEISGRRFPGTCVRLVRPCGEPLNCWGAPFPAASTTSYRWTGFWQDQDGSSLCGCRGLSTVNLAGYPVQEIVEVLIDGAIVDPSTYRLDGHKDLVRLDDPGPPVQSRSWPSCQNLALAETELGTFSVEYKWGETVPDLGRRAAAALACELYRSAAGQQCALPSGATKVTREGVTIERGILTNWFDPTRTSGLPPLDLFLRAYWPSGRRRPAVFSPDVQQYARKLGS